MAALETLNEIVDKHRSDNMREVGPKRANETKPRLMQHAHVAQEEDVKFSGQRRHSYARSGQREADRNTASVKHQNQQHARANTDAIDGQTDVIRTQVMASQKQANLLQQQSGLMQDQLAATLQVSDVMQRLAEFMQQQMTKPEPKIQDTGNTYEGEFKRVSDKEAAAQERRREVMDEMKERRREAQRQRAAKQERDRNGRFTRNTPPRVGPRIQRVGGLGGFGGPGGAPGPGGLPGGGGGNLMRAIVPLLTLGVALYGGKAMEAMRDAHTFEKQDSSMLGRGWQNVKDWGRDATRSSDNNNSYIDKLTRHQGKDVEGRKIGEDAQKSEFGAISAMFESAKGGVGTISTGKGDYGGVSYGAHQLSTKEGSMTAFLRSEEGQQYYNDFRGMAPGSEDFNKKYKEVTDRDGEGMEKAQRKFVTKANYDPVSKWFTKQYGVNLDDRSRALREAIYSVSVQYGPSTAKSVLGDAFGNRDIENMDDAEMISRIQDTRAGSVKDRFRSSSAKTQIAIYERAGVEKAALMKMYNDERSAKVGGVQGAQQQMMNAYGGGSASNGTVGVMAMQQGAGGGGGGSTNGDEAGGGTAAAMLSPADGALYVLGQKHVKPNDNSVNMTGLNPKFKQAFYTMVGDWVQNSGGTVVNVASAFRTRSEQEKLWVKYGRNTKRVARPGTSRHESGFAIDIDRKSAQDLETKGLFKKYGFHRPLSNEPWHVEMIGAGKGGAPQTTPATQSPQLMQQAAAQEMDKAAETTVKRAEENTKGAVVAGAGAGGKAKPAMDSETPGVSKSVEKGAKKIVAEEEEEEEEVGEKEDDIGEPPSQEIKKEAVPPTVDVMGPAPTTRTPEQQALYEQYLKAAGGDPRGVPDAVANPQPTQTPAVVDNSALYAERIRRLKAISAGGSAETPTSTTTTARTSPTMNGGYGGGIGGGYGQPAKPVSQTQTGRAITGAITKIGSVYGLGSFGTMLPGVDKVLKGVDGDVSGVFNKVPGLRELSRIPGIPQIPRLSSGLPSFGNVVTSTADKIGSLFGGGEPTTAPATERPRVMNGQRITYDGPAVQSTDQIGKTSLNAAIPAMSPASSTYYSNDAPVVTKSAGSTPVAKMEAPAQATAMPIAEKVERNSYDGVQKVSMVSSDVAMGDSGASTPGAGAGAGGPGAGAKNDMPQIEDVPSIMDDYGLLFVNMGLV